MRLNISTNDYIFIFERNPDHDLWDSIAIEICRSYGETKTGAQLRPVRILAG